MESAAVEGAPLTVGALDSIVYRAVHVQLRIARAGIVLEELSGHQSLAVDPFPGGFTGSLIHPMMSGPHECVVVLQIAQRGGVAGHHRRLDTVGAAMPHPRLGGLSRRPGEVTRR